MAATRLDKYLADAGAGTRTQVKTILKQGRVTVDGAVCKDGAIKGDYSTSEVCVDGAAVHHEDFAYYLLNKPAGCVSATKDNLSDTVLDLLHGINTKGLFPVGRLDKDTEGLLLITNDGQLAHRMLSPKKHVEKEYYVNLDKELQDPDRQRIEAGIDIGDEKPCLPARIEYVSGLAVKIFITEGRFHQVKRMFGACGYEVTFLKRLSMGPIRLPDDLAPGDFIQITKPIF